MRLRAAGCHCGSVTASFRKARPSQYTGSASVCSHWNTGGRPARPRMTRARRDCFADRTSRRRSPARSRRCARSCSAASRLAQHGRVLAALAPAEHGARRRRAADAAGAERDAADRRAGAADGGRERRPPDHAGRRVAARQLLPDRGTDPHGTAAPPGAATAASCRAWPTVRRPRCRGSTTSPSRRSRTATAGWTPTASAASSRPTRR